MVQTKHIAVVFLAVALSGCGSAVLEEPVSPKTPKRSPSFLSAFLRPEVRQMASGQRNRIQPPLARSAPCGTGLGASPPTSPSCRSCSAIFTRDEAAGAVDEALTLLRPRPLRR